jgi:hypothetical protein
VQGLQGWTSAPVYTGRLNISLVYTGAGTQGWISVPVYTGRLNISMVYNGEGTPEQARYLLGLYRSRIFKVEHMFLSTQEGWSSIWSTQVQDLQGSILFLSTQEGWTSLWSTQVQDLQSWTSVPVYTGRAGHLFDLHRYRISKVKHLFLSTQESWASLWSTQVQWLLGLTAVMDSSTVGLKKRTRAGQL